MVPGVAATSGNRVAEVDLDKPFLHDPVLRTLLSTQPQSHPSSRKWLLSNKEYRGTHIQAIEQLQRHHHHSQ